MKTEPNYSDLCSYVTGLVILAKSTPADLTDANGDNMREGIMQTARDIAVELGIAREVDFNIEGALADVIPVERRVLTGIQAATAALTAFVEQMPRGADHD